MGWNQNSRLDLLHALFVQHTFQIDAYHENTGDKSIYAGHYYSDKAPGIVFLAVPAFSVSVLALRVIGVPLDSQLGWLISSWITTVGSVGIITALGGVALFCLLARLVTKEHAFLTIFVIFLGAAPFPYATMLFSHAAVAGLICIALWAIGDGLLAKANVVRTQDHFSAGQLRRTILAGISCGLAVASEYTAAVAVAGVLCLVALRSIKRATILTTAAVVPLLLIPAYNWICFGGPLSFGYHHLALPEFQKMNEGLFGITFPPNLSALYLIVLSPERGLFFWTPFLLLAVPGMVALFKASRHIAWTVICVTLAQVLCISGYYMPDGGAALGPRHLAPMLPFLAIPAAFGLQRLPRVGKLLGFYSVLLTGLGTVIEAMPPSGINNPLLNFYLEKLLRNEFAYSVLDPLHINASVIFVFLFGCYFILITRAEFCPNGDLSIQRFWSVDWWYTIPEATRRIILVVAGQKALLCLLLIFAPVLVPQLFTEESSARRFWVWDTGHYLHLAAHGYTPKADHCAFYPLWPLCIRIGSFLVGGNLVLSGYLLANLFSLGAFALFHRFVAEKHGVDLANRATILLLLFPGAFFFCLPYTESLFFFLLMVCWVSLQRGKLYGAALAALLLPMTRAIGVFIFPVLLWELLRRRSPRESYVVSAVPLLGYACYFAIMYASTGNPFAGFEAQQNFPAKPSIARIADPVGFARSFADFEWSHSVLHSFIDRGFFLLFLLSLFWAFRMDSGYWVYSVFSGLIPAVSNILMSYTRFLSLVFPLFIVGAHVTVRSRLFWLTCAVLGAWQIGFFLWHIAGGWVG